MHIIITSPSLDTNKNVSGISSITQFIIHNCKEHKFIHFQLGKRDEERRNLLWFLRILKSYIQWIRILLENKNTLVHFNFSFSKPAIIRDSPLIVMAKIFSSRTIIHLHGGEYLLNKEMPRWMKFVLKLVLDDSTSKIVLSSLELERVRSLLGLRNLVVLPNCVELSDAFLFKRNYEQPIGLKLLFLGRISEQKGIEYIYLALQSLKSRGVSFTFTIAGKGEEEELYVPKFRELLGENFEFKGVVSGQEKVNLLKESNVFLLPSFFEGLPMALLESMSFGLVPITTNVGSINNLVKNEFNGIFVEKYSATDIEMAIEKIHTDTNYMALLSRNARQHIFDNYNPQEYIRSLNQIYSHD